jgi:hypothetical protein
MRCEPVQTLRFSAIQRGRTIRNPDTLVIEINLTRSWMTSGLLWTSAWKKRPVEHTQFKMPGRVRYRDRKEARILIVHVSQFDGLHKYFSRRGGTKSGQL